MIARTSASYFKRHLSFFSRHSVTSGAGLTSLRRYGFCISDVKIFQISQNHEIGPHVTCVTGVKRERQGGGAGQKVMQTRGDYFIAALLLPRWRL